MTALGAAVVARALAPGPASPALSLRRRGRDVAAVELQQSAAMYFSRCASDPTDPDRVYMAGVGLHFTTEAANDGD